MKKVRVNLGSRSYDVIIQDHSISEAPQFLEKLNLPKRGAVISNKTVYSLYGDLLTTALKKSGYSIETILVPDGEGAKTLAWAEKIFHFLLKHKFNRETTLFALGGGIVGDLAGYVASVFLRGIPFVQIPTTLLSQVDSSVGGKVAVNLEEGKNLIGSFYQPKLVIIDPSCLKTLPQKEFRDGMAEVIKYGLIMDRPFFDFLSKRAPKINSLDPLSLEKMIYESVRDKASVVIQDEMEKDLRAILNFGHTLGHAIEKTWNYKGVSHGEAVSIGMYLACLLSLKKGILSQSEWDLIKPVFSSYKLPTRLKSPDKSKILSNLYFDKKMTNKGLKYILLQKIGQAFPTYEVKEDEIRDLLDQNL